MLLFICNTSYLRVLFLFSKKYKDAIKIKIQIVSNKNHKQVKVRNLTNKVKLNKSGYFSADMTYLFIF